MSSDGIVDVSMIAALANPYPPGPSLPPRLAGRCEGEKRKGKEGIYPPDREGEGGGEEKEWKKVSHPSSPTLLLFRPFLFPAPKWQFPVGRRREEAGADLESPRPSLSPRPPRDDYPECQDHGRE